MTKQSFSTIARKLKISTAVVSNVMRNTSSTTLASRTTKQRILECAWENGLRLNNNLGIFVPEEVRKNEALFYPAFAGIAERCAQLGFGTFLVNLSEQQPFPNILKKRDVNGIIYWNHGFENLMNVVEEEKIPSVILNPQNESISLDSVSFDNYGTFTELFNYLHSKNYKKYFFLINEDSTDYSQKPLTAFFDFISTCDVFGQILAQNFPDAHELEACVFNSNEETVFIALSRFDTIKIIESFTKFNKTFPIDGGLVGNSILANFYVPKLTTVVNPLYESGLTVVNMIAEKWDSRVFCLKKHISLKVKILKNQSTKGE